MLRMMCDVVVVVGVAVAGVVVVVEGAASLIGSTHVFGVSHISHVYQQQQRHVDSFLQEKEPVDPREEGDALRGQLHHRERQLLWLL